MNCRKCHLAIIDEELQYHVCFTGKIKNVRFDSGMPYLLEIFDGQKWLKCPNLKPSTESKHDKHYRQGNRTCFVFLLLSWDIILPVTFRDMDYYF